MKQGPDGFLYFGIDRGKILRIMPEQIENKKPHSCLNESAGLATTTLNIRVATVMRAIEKRAVTDIEITRMSVAT